MSVKEFKKNEIIFKQGDFSPVMYDILAGQVGIFAAYGTENEKQITVLGEGQLLGEMGLIEAYPRSATAVAMEDGVKLRCGRSARRSFRHTSPNSPSAFC